MKLRITDKRMLMLPGLLKDHGLIDFKKDFYEILGMQRQNINSIKNGTQHFTVRHIEIACNKFGIDPNWIFGFSSEVFRIKNTPTGY